jgi:hypothetical protein
MRLRLIFRRTGAGDPTPQDVAAVLVDLEEIYRYSFWSVADPAMIYKDVLQRDLDSWEADPYRRPRPIPPLLPPLPEEHDLRVRRLSMQSLLEVVAVISSLAYAFPQAVEGFRRLLDLVELTFNAKGRVRVEHEQLGVELRRQQTERIKADIDYAYWERRRRLQRHRFELESGTIEPEPPDEGQEPTIEPEPPDEGQEPT